MEEGGINIDEEVKKFLEELAWRIKIRKFVSSGMSYEIAVRIIRDLVESKPFPVESQEHYLVEAFEIALRNNITVYDALFVAMAKRKNLELATCDEEQAETAGKEGLRATLLS